MGWDGIERDSVAVSDAGGVRNGKARTMRGLTECPCRRERLKMRSIFGWRVCEKRKLRSEIAEGDSGRSQKGEGRFGGEHPPTPAE